MVWLCCWLWQVVGCSIFLWCLGRKMFWIHVCGHRAAPPYDVYDNSGLTGSWRPSGELSHWSNRWRFCAIRGFRPLHGAYPHSTSRRLRSHTYVSVASLHCYVLRLYRCWVLSIYILAWWQRSTIRNSYAKHTAQRMHTIIMQTNNIEQWTLWLVAVNNNKTRMPNTRRNVCILLCKQITMNCELYDLPL